MLHLPGSGVTATFIAHDTLNTSVFPYTMLNIDYTDYQLPVDLRAPTQKELQKKTILSISHVVADHKHHNNNCFVYSADSMK
ncbi:hypothetical protein VNO78_01241 [Psophocarpus tetragonolobus]|uniref:Uncharacterized protein n=1 Tax=Psophocarpus tetragonolobus TaxID=3891 RepID=A0AAN9SXS9_PSOTE